MPAPIPLPAPVTRTCRTVLMEVQWRYADYRSRGIGYCHTPQRHGKQRRRVSGLLGGISVSLIWSVRGSDPQERRGCRGRGRHDLLAASQRRGDLPEIRVTGSQGPRRSPGSALDEQVALNRTQPEIDNPHGIVVRPGQRLPLELGAGVGNRVSEGTQEGECGVGFRRPGSGRRSIGGSAHWLRWRHRSMLDTRGSFGFAIPWRHGDRCGGCRPVGRRAD